MAKKKEKTEYAKNMSRIAKLENKLRKQEEERAKKRRSN